MSTAGRCGRKPRAACVVRRGRGEAERGDAGGARNRAFSSLRETRGAFRAPRNRRKRTKRTHGKRLRTLPHRATRWRTKPRRVRASEFPRGTLPPRERGRAQAIAREELRRRKREQARRITIRNPAVKAGSALRTRNGGRQFPKSGEGRTWITKGGRNQGEKPPRRGGTQARGLFPLIPHTV